ncbi:unnamed protein product [Periconia digitata]|uniref:Nudix hydrolase domain-containing protein n=1 Tax=Periconia digitata TaxID=1303443 RepID=A0A9W4XHY6_9PLEO|nr:unnamed protein product [Periconia digitata]
MTARREAFEEIGLPVLPCIAFLCPSSMSSTSTSETAHDPGGNSINNTPPPTSEVEDKMIPRLDPKEVAAVFTAPFHNFLGTVWEGGFPFFLFPFLFLSIRIPISDIDSQSFIFNLPIELH